MNELVIRNAVRDVQRMMMIHNHFAQAAIVGQLSTRSVINVTDIASVITSLKWIFDHSDKSNDLDAVLCAGELLRDFDVIDDAVPGRAVRQCRGRLTLEMAQHVVRKHYGIMAPGFAEVIRKHALPYPFDRMNNDAWSLAWRLQLDLVMLGVIDPEKDKPFRDMLISPLAELINLPEEVNEASARHGIFCSENASHLDDTHRGVSNGRYAKLMTVLGHAMVNAAAKEDLATEMAYAMKKVNQRKDS